MPPYDYKRFIATKKYIIDNFDVIITGHAGIIRNGKYIQKKIKVKEF